MSDNEMSPADLRLRLAGRAEFVLAEIEALGQHPDWTAELAREMATAVLACLRDDAITTFWGYPVEEAIQIIKRAEDAGLADRSKRLWDDAS